MISPQQIQRITNRIVDVYQPEKIILFGSYAHGTASENSDLDLLIIKETEEASVDRAAMVRKSMRDFLLPMDILVYTPQEIEENQKSKFSFIYQVIKTGKLLYDRS